MKQDSGGRRTMGSGATSGNEASMSSSSQASQSKAMPQVTLSKRPSPRSSPTPPPATTEAAADPPVDLNARLGLQTSVEASPPLSSPPSAPGDTRQTEAQELLRLLRDPQTGQLVVVVAGKPYRRLSEVTDKTSGEHILQAAAHLLHFTNGMILAKNGIQSLVAPPVEPLNPLPMSSETSVTETVSATSSLSGLATPPISQPPVTEPTSFPPRPVTTTDKHPQRGSAPPSGQAEPAPRRSGFLGRFGPKQPETPEVPVGLNLAEEINEIVQLRLAASPLAATTKITVEADLSGGIRIDVNGTVHQTPEEIADPDIKALVKSSIQAWEKS